MPPVGFKPTISAGKRPQTYALDRSATGTGCYKIYTGVFVPGLDKTTYSLYGINVPVEIWPVHLPTSSNKIHAKARYFATFC